MVVERLLPDHLAGRVRLVAAARRPDAATVLRARGIDCHLIDLDDPETD